MLTTPMQAKIKRKITALFAASFMLITTPLLAESLDLAGRSKADMQQDSARKPVEVINFAQVKKGDKVLDLLAGGGYYSELLSRAVGDKGAVTLQIPKAYLKYAKKALDVRLANERLKNVNYLLSEAEDLKLTDNTYDSAFLVLGFHDMFFQEDGTIDVIEDNSLTKSEIKEILDNKLEELFDQHFEKWLNSKLPAHLEKYFNKTTRPFGNPSFPIVFNIIVLIS